MTTSSCKTSFNAMMHPPFRVCVREEQNNKFLQPPELFQREHDHLQCRQHLSTALRRHNQDIIFFGGMQESHCPGCTMRCAAGAFVLPFSAARPVSLPPVNLHKTLPRSLAADSAEFSNEIFKNRFRRGIIFVKYATKAERCSVRRK